jgi:diguanylate cyclase (GGDEF)-like protein
MFNKFSRFLTITNQYAPWSIALRLSTIYLILGSIWILTSDKVVQLFVKDRNTMTLISMVKGWIYVLLTAVLIFVLIYNTIKRIKGIEQELLINYEKLKITHDELAAQEEFNNLTINCMINAFALHRIILDDEGNPCDYEYININPSFESFTGLKKEDVVRKRYRELVPQGKNDSLNWVSIYGNVALTGIPISLVSFTEAFGKWVSVNAYSPKKGYFITVFQDISELKKNEVDLTSKNEELSVLYEDLMASDEELRQQFDELSMHEERLRVSEERFRLANEELQEYQSKLHTIAYFDHLTGLHNRSSLYETLLHEFKDDVHTNKAMLFIDTDNFKFINDTLGHAFGDKLITAIGHRLSSISGCTNNVYRIGGDEFIIWLKNYQQAAEIEELAESVLQSFKRPFGIGNTILYETVSIGISLCPEHCATADEMLTYADIAMYQAKKSGKNRYMFYNQLMMASVNERMVIEKNLHTALDNNEFELYYQPQIDMKNGKISGFEALIRWNSAELGSVSPTKFIDIAEDTHLIIPIGEWVLRNACFFIKNLHLQGYSDLTISVNISILQLLQEDFINIVTQALEFINLNPNYLELEITESVLMESYDAIYDKLQWLREKGVKLALDDFGKGYSSLSYLAQLPITTLKIDKTFIDNISESEEDASITGTIVMIGKKMGLTVVAEGVETKEQLNYLLEHKCSKIQGYYYSKPLPQDKAIKLIKEEPDIVL